MSAFEFECCLLAGAIVLMILIHRGLLGSWPWSGANKTAAPAATPTCRRCHRHPATFRGRCDTCREIELDIRLAVSRYGGYDDEPIEGCDV